jgi:SAM-dependent MidA family methyltransferase
MTASAPPSILPSLSDDERRHSQALERLIRERIAEAGGWLSFESFMELALYAPGLGYYSAGSVKIGAAGDFVTAPELSDSFSRCVAEQCAEIFQNIAGQRADDSPIAGGGRESAEPAARVAASTSSIAQAATVLELGAGTGRMAATILETLAALDAVPERYAILEVSADLRERQRETLGRLPRELRDRVEWLDRLPERPFKGIVLANEVLDALPCHRFVVRARRARPLGVAIDQDGRLIERETPADSSKLAEAMRAGVLSAAMEDLALESTMAEMLGTLPAELPEGYRSELNLRVAPWIASLADVLEQGVMLLFDYGLPRAHFYHPQRSAGTLRCHYKQRAHDDPLINIGVQDITAWVDFTLVAESAVAANLDVLGFATQAAFLLGTGIDKHLPPDAGALDQARWASQARQLLLPGEMGETFKVMALGRNYDGPLRGFALQDLRRSL